MDRFVLYACLLASGTIAFPVGHPEAPGYHGYKLLSVLASTPEQVQLLNGLADTDYELDFWTHPMLNKPADIMIPPARFPAFVRTLTHAGLKFEVKQSDVQAMIEEVAAQNEAYKLLKTVTPFTSLNHNQYYTYNQIVSHLQTLSTQFPDLTRFDETGKTPDRPRSEEGRTIHVFELSADLDNKPVIMFDVNIHAREHITAASMLYTIDWLLTNYASNSDAKAVLDQYHLVVVPVANPDGYEYSLSSASTRLWRKNRRYISSLCTGVDLNRNFPEPEYTSSASCSAETYPGPYPSSEAETLAIQKIFAAFQENLAIYLPVHCYSQILLTPYASSSTGATPCNGEYHDAAGKAMADAIKAVDGRTFQVGPPAKTIGYPAKGTSGDWAVHEKPGIISIAYELRPSGNASNGFVLPSSEIVTAGNELLSSLVAISKYVADLNPSHDPCQ